MIMMIPPNYRRSSQICYLVCLVVLLLIRSSLVSPENVECGDDASGCEDSTTPKMDKHCLQLCDKHRPIRNSDKYVLNCSELHAGDDNEIENCIGICDHCPHSICNSQKDPHLFHCRPLELNGHCVERCDLKRPSNGSAYQLNCHTMYDNDNDRHRCQKECTEHCPFICEKHGKTEVLHCPSGVAGPTLSETSWFITTLVILIPALILITVLIWKCIYNSRNADLTEADPHRYGQTYQEQLHQDPNMFISPNGDDDPMITLQSEQSMPVMISSITSYDYKRKQQKQLNQDDDSLSILSKPPAKKDPRKQ